jgi:hypothetical protein
VAILKRRISELEQVAAHTAKNMADEPASLQDEMGKPSASGRLDCSVMNGHALNTFSVVMAQSIGSRFGCVKIAREVISADVQMIPSMCFQCASTSFG